MEACFGTTQTLCDVVPWGPVSPAAAHVEVVLADSLPAASAAAAAASMLSAGVVYCGVRVTDRAGHSAAVVSPGVPVVDASPPVSALALGGHLQQDTAAPLPLLLHGGGVVVTWQLPLTAVGVADTVTVTLTAATAAGDAVPDFAAPVSLPADAAAAVFPATAVTWGALGRVSSVRATAVATSVAGVLSPPVQSPPVPVEQAAHPVAAAVVVADGAWGAGSGVLLAPVDAPRPLSWRAPGLAPDDGDSLARYTVTVRDGGSGEAVAAYPVHNPAPSVASVSTSGRPDGSAGAAAAGTVLYSHVAAVRSDGRPGVHPPGVGAGAVFVGSELACGGVKCVGGGWGTGCAGVRVVGGGGGGGLGVRVRGGGGGGGGGGWAVMLRPRRRRVRGVSPVGAAPRFFCFVMRGHLLVCARGCRARSTISRVRFPVM